MHTPDMSDEELDALFQRGAEHYPDEHNLSAWLAMERKLDAQAMQQQVRGKVLRIFALETVIVLLALLGWLGWRGWSRPAGVASGNATREFSQLAAAPTPVIVGLPAGTSPGLSAKPAIGVDSKLHPAPTAGKPLADLQPAAASMATEPANPTPGLASGRVKPVGFDDRQPRRRTWRQAGGPVTRNAKKAGPGLPGGPALTEQPKLTKTESAAARPASPAMGSPIAGLSSATSAPADQPAGNISRPEPGSNAAPATHLQAPESQTPRRTGHPFVALPVPSTAVSAAPPPATTGLPSREAVPVKSPAPDASDSVGQQAAVVAAAPAGADSTTTEKPRDQVKSPPRLSFALLYSPELSTVRWASYTTPGSNLGAALEYRFAQKWRISAGMLRSVKRYAARGSDYHPPAGYWTNSYAINKVDATCRIIDIPLNLRYDLRQGARTAVFASAGLSSLLMRNEAYRYNYYSYGKPVSRDWSLRKGSNHFLSVLNLSAGYERTFGGRWAVQGEPFVKIPLGGVGFGRVKLSSTGVFFALKYALLPASPVVR
ncbi:hypothetical protein GCM10022408_16930 [Hymenobacter fastidiosus]|uniref:Outer membrane protein beta-barrel domain-containing protein n=1 Tax=Hymenobacter fastidiosus TaxID=486264 RepID=A0ABP7S2P8_9BACT